MNGGPKTGSGPVPSNEPSNRRKRRKEEKFI
jgi:hypothetical protein